MKYIKLLVLLIWVMLIVHILYSALKAPPAPTGTEVYVVRSNDTLWDISKDYCPKDMDLREYVYEVERYNDIDANIKVGQRIDMLIYEGGE